MCDEFPGEILDNFNNSYPLIQLLKRFESYESNHFSEYFINYIHNKKTWKATINIKHWICVEKDINQINVKLPYNGYVKLHSISIRDNTLRHIKELLNVDRIKISLSKDQHNTNIHFFRKNEDISFLLVTFERGFPELSLYDRTTYF